MQKSQIIQPAAMQAPFAVLGDKNLPNYEAVGTETSSIKEGFLPITQEPLPPNGNGQAPERADFNGMFYLSTDFRVFQQNGGFITFDAAVSTKIGGYPQDAILGYINNIGQYGFVKSLHDNNTADFVTTPSLINGTDWAYVPIVNTIETIKLIYPIGSLYIGTQSTCPLAALFGTWQLVAANKALWTGNGSNGNTSINAGLPNITASTASNGDHTHTRGTMNITGRFSQEPGDKPGFQGAFYQGSRNTNNSGASGGDYDYYFMFDASRSWTGATSSNGAHKHNITISDSGANILNKSTTVQPPAYVVNVWRRTA